LAFDGLKVNNDVIVAAAIVGFFAFAIGMYSTLTISETHNKDLDFNE
jgi:uncharacterized membrane protein